MAVRGRDAHRHLGLERRRFVEPERNLPLPRSVPVGDGRRAGGRHSLLRHDLSGAVLRPAAGSPRRIQTKLADHLRGSIEGAIACRSRHGRRQRSLPGNRSAHQRAGRRKQAVHDDGLSEPLARHLRRRGHHAAFVRIADAVFEREAAAGATGGVKQETVVNNMPGEDWEVVKQGTWLYTDEIVCGLRILRHGWYYGSGDYEDEESIREDR